MSTDDLNLVPITDPHDERVADYVRLRDVSLRRSLEVEQGLFIAEGEKVIRRALAARFRPRSFLLAPRWIDSLADQLAAHPEVPVYVVSEALAEEVTGFHVHRGALASMVRHTRWQQADLMGMQRLVVCEDIVDHANVGAILRSAAGMGWDGCLLAPRAADPLYRRAIKVSMGAVFSLPWARVESWAQVVPQLHEAGFLTLALALDERSRPLPDVAASLADDQRVAILLGTEGEGLSRRWIEQADQVVRIPMGHGIDSLNVAAASAVACYALGPSGRPSAEG
ncbi:tRNA G18 (ribose-2'-O)-methylase SpoU [Raineyella antarctica]|uniref:tRNA G18 (Ribose-2'-O)-methylase SpoU n=1 Tax=Raineyella antarctica TaxID=1577474 RepID=A0A1G6HAR1_9ACTN|nr:RNA methyltransferase [Raineyella antarctica]SDB91015.1 tRNA G18 (ribose-2'-O)-methylase SpoU [Raineyella antarctica]